MVYLIHFDVPYRHAQHYLGFVNSDDIGALYRRLRRHERGDGARLLQVIREAGISWRLVRIWRDGDRELERRLKKHGKSRICPLCNADIGPGNWVKTRSKRVKMYCEARENTNLRVQIPDF